MRTVGVVVGVLMGVLLWQPAAGLAQATLAATQVDTRRLPSNAALTLRPRPGAEALAERLAKVLELRLGALVLVGSAPPPGLLEAVPAGHLAVDQQDGTVVLVFAGGAGRAYHAKVQLSGPPKAADIRALALAVEALRDGALETRTSPEVAVETGQAQERSVSEDVPMRPQLTSRLMADGGDVASRRERSFLQDVAPLLYVGSYVGGSAASSTVVAGVMGGVGICSIGYCLHITGELPLNGGSTRAQDVRYRYATFTAGFYARPEPLRFGPLAPGARLGFLTRLGHFDRDMGVGESGLETDLGVRGSLELAWRALGDVEILAEGGFDHTIDHWVVNGGEYSQTRGDRTVPWVQAGVRYRPY